jgi:hypothetical protein
MGVLALAQIVTPPKALINYPKTPPTKALNATSPDELSSSSSHATLPTRPKGTSRTWRSQRPIPTTQLHAISCPITSPIKALAESTTWNCKPGQECKTLPEHWESASDRKGPVKRPLRNEHRSRSRSQSRLGNKPHTESAQSKANPPRKAGSNAPVSDPAASTAPSIGSPPPQPPSIRTAAEVPTNARSRRKIKSRHRQRQDLRKRCQLPRQPTKNKKKRRHTSPRPRSHPKANRLRRNPK